MFDQTRATNIHPLAAFKHLTRTVTQPTTGNGPCGTKTHMVATKIPLLVFLAAFNQQPYVSQKSMWISAPKESLLKGGTEMITYPKQLKSGQTHVSGIQQSRPLTCPAESKLAAVLPFISPHPQSKHAHPGGKKRRTTGIQKYREEGPLDTA